MAFAKNIIFQTSVTLAGTYINCKSLDPVDVSCAGLEEWGGGLGGLENPKFLNSHNNYNNVPENRNLKPNPPPEKTLHLRPIVTIIDPF